MSFFAPNVLSLVISSRDWSRESFKTEKQEHYAIHFETCCMVADQYQHLGVKKYTILEGLPYSTQSKTCQMFLPRGAPPYSRMPDILNNEDKKAYDVTVVRGNIDLAYMRKVDECDPRVIPLVFTIDGEAHPLVYSYLDEEQVQCCQQRIVQYRDWVVSRMTLDEYYRRVSDTGKEALKIPQEVHDFAKEHSDFKIGIKLEGVEPPKERIMGHARQWQELTELPVFDLNARQQEAEWKGYLKMGDSTAKSLPVGDDFSAYKAELQILKGHPVHSHLLKRAFESLKNETIIVPREINFDMMFGIGLKAEKRKADHDDYDFHDYIIPKRSPAKWFEKELDGLCDFDAPAIIDLDTMPSYLEVDDLSNKIADKFMEHLASRKVLSCIEKLCTTSTKIMNNIDIHRDSLLAVPITTRTTENLRLWGILVMGPRHLKQDSDKFQINTFEFVESYNQAKYPRDQVIKVKYNEEQFTVLARTNSLYLAKIHAFSNCRRVLLPPLNAFSKICLNQSVTNQTLVISDARIKMLAKGLEEEVPVGEWLVRLTSLQLLMCLMNDSQTEGFFGNIRRLHMSRAALISGRKVFYAPGGTPASKVQECLINNPVALYMAETWNNLPVRY